MGHKPLYLETDFYKMGTFHLMLGSACDMHCRHCVQNPIKNSYGCIGSQEISSKVYQLINNYIAYAVNHGDVKEPAQIIFWGGEPLVYWKTIKEIIEQFDKKWHFSTLKSFYFAIFTNGTFLDKEKLDFMQKHNIFLYFSYDAPYPWAVRDYVSDKVCNLVDSYKLSKVISNACSYNYDILLARKCLKAKFPHVGNYGLGAYGFHVNRVSVIPEDIYKYDWDALKDSLRRIRIAIKLGDQDALNVMFESVFKYLRRGRNDNFPTNWEPRCTVGKFQLATTLDGKIPICHNTIDWIASVDDSLDMIRSQVKQYVKEKQTSHCFTCEHVDLCHGICPMELRDGDISVVCKDFRFQFYTLLKEELVKLNKPLDNVDVLWYREQEKLMKQQVQEFLLEGQRYEKEHTRFPKYVKKIDR